MKLSFKIDYQTVWGQEILIAGSRPEFGVWDPSHALVMKNVAPGDWEYEGVFPIDGRLEYKYLLKEGDGTIIWESGKNRVLEIGDSNIEEVRCRDFWRVRREATSAMSSSAFTNVLMRRNEPSFLIEKSPAFSSTLRIQIKVIRVSADWKVGILGDQPMLGNWQEDGLLLLDDSRFPLWQIDLDADKLKFPFQFKYVIYDTIKKKIIVWEQGSNRMIRNYHCKQGHSMKVHTDENFRYPLSHWRGAGLSVPLFSLRTENSGGIGEFQDLKKLVDWAKLSGLKMIQLLSLNESMPSHDWMDFYPYKLISSVALHPVYLNLNKMGILDDESLSSGFSKALAAFNALDTVHFDDLYKVKIKFFRLLFELKYETFLCDASFLKFFEQNSEWLIPYAAYCFLRDKYKTENFNQWPEYSVYNKAEILQLCAPDNENVREVSLYYFIQYHAHKQLLEAAEYARVNGVVLKSDVMLGISAHSVDAWSQPELFHLDQQIGAPPDDWASTGQNWGIPSFNWDKMAENQFSWWRQRLNHMALYFDAIRFEHIDNFFRFWEIPFEQIQGVMGHFSLAQSFSRDEIIDRGILFNEERYTKPYIRDYFLWDLFGEEVEKVKKLYLTEYEPGKYDLKPAFSTQRKIWNHFELLNKKSELSGNDVRIRDGLCNLVAELIFVRDPLHPSRFYPRVDFHDTNSYMNLPDDIRYSLDELYIDFFHYRNEPLWEKQALKLLPALMNLTDLLIFGDDLLSYLYPDCISKVMRDLGIISLEVARMSKDAQVEFFNPADALYLSVCATSTSEMSTLSGWWEEDPVQSERYFKLMLGQTGEFSDFLEPSIARNIINMHLQSPAMWAIFPMQDLLAIDDQFRWNNSNGERVNIPAAAKHFWRYRMPQTVEDLLSDKKLMSDIASKVNSSGRNSYI